MSDNSIHKVVRDRYGSIARSIKTSPAGQADSCCGDSADCCPGAGLYNVKMLDDLPLDVTGLSLGCGDPVSIASLRPGETVLDLGSGGGIDCFLAAREVGEAGRVIGVDMTPDMLLKANANKQKMRVKNVEFRQGQIEALPVDSSSIDVILSNCVINLSPDKASVFREAFRVLKPGGRVSISDIVTEGDFSPELRARTDKWAECVTGAIDAGVYMGIMLDAGFVDIEVVNKTDADNIIPREEGMPRIFSARITGHKPTGSEIHSQTRSA